MIYLDAAATTLQKPDSVRLAVLRAMQRCASVGRGGHPPAMEAAESVYRCRQIAAELFGAEAEQVVFTMNATHALNIAVRSLVHSGVDAVVILDGKVPHAVLLELFTDHGAGTLIRRG